MEEQKMQETKDPSYPKERPFYCCQCKRDTNGYSTCYDCGHMKGRWKTDRHHCDSNQERKETMKKVNQEFQKLLVQSKNLGFH